jgi:hypothetical protein
MPATPTVTTGTPRSRDCERSVSLLTHSPSTPWRRVGDDILLAPIGRDDFDHLSGTAAVVWSLLDSPRSMDDLVSTLAELYSIPAEGIAGDVQALVADLVGRGAVQEVRDIQESHD